MGKELYRMTINICDRCKKEKKIEGVIPISFYSEGKRCSRRLDLCENCIQDYYSLVSNPRDEYELLLGTKFMNTHE